MISGNNLLPTAAAVLKSRMGKRVPLKVTQYVTYRCNLKCGFCGRRLLSSEEMTTDQIKTCMRSFKKMGTIYWGFNGGEPLLRDDLGELLNFAKSLGMECSVSTNGVFVPKRINDLAPADLVLLSIDGPEEIQDGIRGPGVYEKTLTALERLKSAGKKVIIITVLNARNLPYLKAVLDLSAKFGCYHELQPVVCHRGDREKNALNFFPAKEDFQKAVDFLIAEKRSGRRITNSFEYLQELRHYPDSVIDQKCWASALYCCITPDGKVLPCSEMLSHNNDQAPWKSGLEIGWEEAFRALPEMSGCRECFFSCYSEYNLILNRPVRSGFKMLHNMFSRERWFWE